MEKTGYDGFVAQILKGVITALCITLVSVLCFALILNLTSLGDGVIKPVNRFIKLAAVFCGACVTVKGGKGFLKGSIIGLSATVLSFLIFALIGGGFDFGWNIFIDVICGTISGGLSGAVAVNLPGRA